MPEQELEKWTNKLKLWMSLHPDENILHTDRCKRYCPYHVEYKRCRSSFGDTGEIMILSLVTYLPNMIRIETSKTMSYKCVEWIKYA